MSSDRDTGDGDAPQMEDYGRSDVDDADLRNAGRDVGTYQSDLDTGTAVDSTDRSNMAVNAFSGGGGPGGTGQDSGEAEQFGEFDDSRTGTDLTTEWDATDNVHTDVRTGLVKGGQPGEDEDAGPAQYGGETGGQGRDR